MSSWLMTNEDQRQLLSTLLKALQVGQPHQWTTPEAGPELEALLERAANLGAFALLVPEDAGGGSWSEQPVLDAALATGILGADLGPIPLPELTAAAGLLTACPDSAQRNDLLAEHAAGERLCLVPFRVEDSNGCSVRPSLTEGRLSAAYATFVGVPDAAFLLLPVQQAGQALLLRLDLEEVLPAAVALTSLDLTRPVWRLDLTDLQVTDDQLLPIEDADVRWAIGLATALVCAEVVAGIDALLQQTVEYSLTREAFGAVIGSFQALKHLLADARMQLEAAKAVTLSAVEAFSDRADWAVEAASIAKVFVDEHAVAIAMDCLQVFGGIGFSWEHELHLYMRRAGARLGAFGTRPEHLRAIDDLHISEWEVAG